MTEKAFRQLNIDPEFKNLIRPLRREEYRQLELNLVMEGCREDIIAWNDTVGQAAFENSQGTTPRFYGLCRGDASGL